MKQNNHVVEVQKTDKIDIDKEVHGLPPGNGQMEEFKVADYFCPDEWSKDGAFIAVEEGEPLWFDLRGNGECACLPAVQRLNPITGEPANLEVGLSKDPKQNYMTLPGQRWLDGYVNDGKVYQFVITKAGEGLAVNEFVLPKHMQDSHAVAFAFYEPKNPKPVAPPRTLYLEGTVYAHGFAKSAMQKCGSDGMGMSSGGTLWNSSDVFGGMGNDALRGSVEYNVGASASDDISAEILFCSAEESGASSVCNDDVEVVDDPEIIDILEQQEEQDSDKASMGQGGRIDQLITTDDNTIDYYHEKPSAVLTIYFALPGVFKSIMKKGKRQDKSRPDKYKTSGKIGGVQVPLI